MSIEKSNLDSAIFLGDVKLTGFNEDNEETCIRFDKNVIATPLKDPDWNEQTISGKFTLVSESMFNFDRLKCMSMEFGRIMSFLYACKMKRKRKKENG